MPTIGMGFAWDELAVGTRFRTHRRTITEADLVQFTNLAWLTEELFTISERAGMAIGGRVVPAALVYAFAEGLLLPSMQGTGLAFFGAQLDVLKPTLVGDTIHVECTVAESRASHTPGRGLVRTINRVMNQHEEAVLVYNPLRLMRSRGSSDQLMAASAPRLATAEPSQDTSPS
jgi:acyl dehydratase